MAKIKDLLFARHVYFMLLGLAIILDVASFLATFSIGNAIFEFCFIWGQCGYWNIGIIIFSLLIFAVLIYLTCKFIKSKNIISFVFIIAIFFLYSLFFKKFLYG